MLVSRNLIEKYIDLSAFSDKEIADKLTFAGLEVEEYSKLAVGTNLVIGQVLKFEKIEGTHLSLLQVNLGEKYGVSQIVCGAPNVKENIKVIVARPGAVLKDLTIKNGNIRGYESNGMVCSLLELGVDEKHLTEEEKTGIQILDDQAPVGEENVLDYLYINDTIFNIKPLANRSDVLAVFSLVKELGSLFNLKTKLPTTKRTNTVKPKAQIEIKSSKTKQFAIKEIYGVEVKPSPLWLAVLLQSMNIRAINNIVDIGNFIMLLTGQPLHMYDIDKIDNLNFSVVDNLNTNFIALDEQTYNLKDDDLVVCVNNKPSCIAGVSGASYCQVDSTTKNIAIEAAYFNPASVRKTAIRLNLVSEASTRFAKGINPHQASVVLDLTALLIEELVGFKKESSIVNVDHIDHQPLLLRTNYHKINNLLGSDFTKEEITNTLTNLNFKISTEKDLLTVEVPSFRIDINTTADLAEEVIRLRGFENVKTSLSDIPYTKGGYTSAQEKVYNLRHFLLSNGISEVLSYSLVNQKQVEQFKFINNGTQINLEHPMTPEHSIMRLNLMPSLLETARYNYARQTNNFAIFEVSNVYTAEGENKHLGIVLVGEKEEQGLLNKRPYSYYDGKGLVEQILNNYGIKPNRYKIVEVEKENNQLHPYQASYLYFGKTLIGYFGKLHPLLTEEYNFNKTPVIVIELDLNKIIEVKTSPIKMAPISIYPSITRDLAFNIDKNVEIGSIISLIKSVDTRLISNVDVFDIFESEKLPIGTKSVGFKITYRDETRTLTDNDVKIIEENIKKQLHAKLGVTLRG